MADLIEPGRSHVPPNYRAITLQDTDVTSFNRALRWLSLHIGLMSYYQILTADTVQMSNTIAATRSNIFPCLNDNRQMVVLVGW